MNKQARIYVAGHNGLVGSALMRVLRQRGHENLITASSKELDLRDQKSVTEYYSKHKPEYVFVAAAKVGGILANDTYPADFIYDNLMIEANLIHGAYQANAKKLLFLGSTCIYPRMASQPLKEEYLLTGPLEPTNEWYAVAKIAGIKLCQALKKQHGCHFFSVMPTNLYGPGDNFDLENSHVLPALIRKFDEAKMRNDPEVVVWGTGEPKREFLHVDDCASACLFLMEQPEAPDIVNVGTSNDIRIYDLAELVKKIVGFDGKIVYDTSKPDGTPRKLVDTDRVNKLGWHPSIPLEEGIFTTYNWYKENRIAKE